MSLGIFAHAAVDTPQTSRPFSPLLPCRPTQQHSDRPSVSSRTLPMDADRVEALLRSQSRMPSRRRTMRLLLGLALASPLAALGVTTAEGKHQKHKQKHRGGCKPTTCAAQGATCGPRSDGCGGTLQCGSCPSDQCLICGAGNTCVSGCPASQLCCDQLCVSGVCC